MSFFSGCNSSEMFVGESFNEPIAFQTSAVNTHSLVFTGRHSCHPAGVDACLQPACLSPDPTFHLSPSRLSPRLWLSLLLASAEPLFRQRKAIETLSLCRKTSINTHRVTLAWHTQNGTAVERHGNKAGVHKQWARLFGLFGAKGWNDFCRGCEVKGQVF